MSLKSDQLELGFSIYDCLYCLDYFQPNVCDCVRLFAYWCRLLIAFANSLDPDQAQQMPYLIWIKLFDTLMVFLKESFKKLILKKKNRRQKSRLLT